MALYPPWGAVSNVWRHFLGAIAVGVSAKSIQWVKARDAAQHPTVHRTPLYQKMIQPQTSQHWVEKPGLVQVLGPPNQPRARKSLTSWNSLCQEPSSSCPAPAKETRVAAELSRKSLMGMLQVSKAPHITTVNRGSLQVAGGHMSSWPDS